MTARVHRWLFADQLGPHFLDDADDPGGAPVLLVESRSAFARRRFHRQKAHLVLSAIRHRAAELGDRAVHLRTATYRQALDDLGGPIQICAPTTRAARAFVDSRPDVEVLPERGFVTAPADFARWAAGRGGRRLLLEDFYRDTRRRTGVLMDGAEPAGGRWNYDELNREPPPKVATLPLPAPWWPEEDEIDAEVRTDLDSWEAAGDVRFVGRDGPRRFAVTATEAQSALEHFLDQRLSCFGRWEDAMLDEDDVMAHSLLSAPLNLGLLDPLAVAQAAEERYRSGLAELASVEGFVRQIIGWRDYIWHLYWHLGPDYRTRNALDAHEPVPDWLWDLDADAVNARCLSAVLRQVRDTGWTHHIPRLMVLGNWALQRGIDPAQLTDWFHHSFVDGYEWVMEGNVIGMSQHADGGLLATKPYAAGGAYLNRMSDYCRGCTYNPKIRVGPQACPFTAGYWSFLHRTRTQLTGNQRMRQPLAGLDRLSDLDALLEQERGRGTAPP
ncbi:MAG: cryptochrome/photolyase family protein [Sporichthyaceae bacterium]